LYNRTSDVSVAFLYSVTLLVGSCDP